MDDLLAVTKSATGTGLSELFDGKFDHEKVARFLSESYINLEAIKLKSGINHFAIKATLIAVTTKAAFLALRQLPT